MAYKEKMEEACQKLDGALACTIMGYDGIAVDSVQTPAAEGDPNSFLIEFSGMLNQATQSGEFVTTGQIQDFVIHGDKVSVAMRPLSEEYFIGMVMKGTANIGKARFLLRILGPQVKQELLA